MERVLVTGGLGFIGSHLATKLNDLNYSTFVIDNRGSGSGCLDISDPKVIGSLLKCVNMEQQWVM